jgi:hypothetical protein
MNCSRKMLNSSAKLFTTVHVNRLRCRARWNRADPQPP